MSPSLDTEMQRLRAYYPFDDTVLKTVATVSEQYRHRSWERVREALPKLSIFKPRNGKPIEVIDMLPSDGYDATYIYHPPIGNGLDANILTRLSVLYDTLPGTRIIATGNPTHPFKSTGKIPIQQLAKIWDGELESAATPTLEYIAVQNIATVSHVGYSYGADRAAEASRLSHTYGQHVARGIFMEPAGIMNRSALGLAIRFARSGAALPDYVRAAQSATLTEARRQAAREGQGILGALAFLRASNIAIAHGLTHDAFLYRVTSAMDSQDVMQATLVWATDSEIALHGVMQQTYDKLADCYPRRVRRITVPAQKHAMGDDIFLHAALVLQSVQTKPRQSTAS